MTLDRKEAAASLDDVAAIERRTREMFYYTGSSTIMILWGVLTTAGQLVNWFAPHRADIAWIAIDIGGFVATAAIVARRLPQAQWRAAGLRWAASYLAFVVYGFIWMAELWPLAPRQEQVFWQTLVMFAYVLAGIWIGRFFLYVGAVATALILVGFYFIGDWLALWLAAVLGGGLIAGGLWLRRVA